MIEMMNKNCRVMLANFWNYCCGIGVAIEINVRSKCNLVTDALNAKKTLVLLLEVNYIGSKLQL